IPGPGPEPVGAGQQGADRAYLHGVAAEVGREGLVGEGQDLHLVAAVDEVDEGVAGDLVGETGAAGALDAALAVEQHQVADGDGLLEVALLFDEPALARSEGERLVLERGRAAAAAARPAEGLLDQ